MFVISLSFLSPQNTRIALWKQLFPQEFMGRLTRMRGHMHTLLFQRLPKPGQSPSVFKLPNCSF